MKNKFKIKSLPTKCDHCKGSGVRKEIYFLINGSWYLASDVNELFEHIENFGSYKFSNKYYKLFDDVINFLETVGCKIYVNVIRLSKPRIFKKFMDNFCKRYDACYERIK